MDETVIIENLLSRPYWLIDVLPKQVSADLYEKDECYELPDEDISDCLKQDISSSSFVYYSTL